MDLNHLFKFARRMISTASEYSLKQNRDRMANQQTLNDLRQLGEGTVHEVRRGNNRTT